MLEDWCLPFPGYQVTASARSLLEPRVQLDPHESNGSRVSIRLNEVCVPPLALARAQERGLASIEDAESMPKRPHAHVVGDQATNEVAGVWIACGCACERVTSDYGEDLVVQPALHQRVDPFQIRVQVKGTSSLQRFRRKDSVLRSQLLAIQMGPQQRPRGHRPMGYK